MEDLNFKDSRPGSVEQGTERTSRRFEPSPCTNFRTLGYVLPSDVPPGSILVSSFLRDTKLIQRDTRGDGIR